VNRGPFDGEAAQSAERAVTTSPAGCFRQQLVVRLASLPWLLLCVVILADIAWMPLALGWSWLWPPVPVPVPCSWRTN